jgi:exonuclease SbcC
MIIRSIRLKNIKSYGEGADGTGVTVNFEPGINRIAGKNGHGKSTLIESLGFALFLTEPAYEENFKVDTYLLRTGFKSGEIAITFEHEQALYRLERGVGQSGIRAKVIALADNSIEAEGEKEVSDYICATLGLPGPARLSELFSKLIGVKQGRLTWPFDSKPTEAKKFFEPLLDVQVFRDCFDKLLPVMTLFAKDQQALEVKRSGVEARLQDRADGQQKLDEALKNKETQEGLVEALNGQKGATSARRQALENFEKAFLAADSLFRTAEKENGEAALRATNATARVEEAKGAAAIVAGSVKEYEGYVAAEKALRELRQQQQVRDKLVRDKSESVNRRTEKTVKADACADKVKLLTRQASEAEGEVRKAREKSSKIIAELKATQDAHALEEKKVKACNVACDGLRNWMAGCGTAIELQGERREEMVGAWDLMKETDPEALARAESLMKNTRNASEKLVVALSEARAAESSLAEQLAQIDKGVCPFLQEPCRQFKPEKVQADLKKQQGAVVELAKKLAQAGKALMAAEKDEAIQRKLASQLGESKVAVKALVELALKTHAGFLPAPVEKWLEILRTSLPGLQKGIRLPELPGMTLKQVLDQQGRLHPDSLEEMIGAEEAVLAAAVKLMAAVEPECQRLESACEAAGDKRIQARSGADSLVAQAGTLDEKRKKTLAVVEEEEQRKTGFAGEAEGLTAALEELEKKLAAYVALDKDIQRYEEAKRRHEGGYNRYMGANALAMELMARQEALKVAADTALKVATALAGRRMERDEAAKKCEADVLKRLREEEAELIGQLGQAQAVLAGIKRDENVQRGRMKEWMAACAERDSLQGEMERLEAATAITEKARLILKAAAPFVAQSICTRIAGQAQQIFNQVNHEPVLLEWDSERYSLTVSPGDRRFAMLSGGEQTKLALAMTLAMIGEFSQLKFCIFDEPTYGVDAESRQRLADAILQLQTAAGFDQLLLVSHDDSFEGKIEHTVLMQKTAASGSYAEIIS